MGEFSRKGKSRLVIKAADHDFQAKETMTPYGILLPDHHRLYLYCTQGRVTSDFISDCIADCWQQIQMEQPQVQTLLLYQDNGPENHSRRTQFMYRMTQFADETDLTIRLAYYPPYHSKYNPIERVWSALEQHWNGSLLDSVEAVLGFTQLMTWQKIEPTINLVTGIYETGKKLSLKAMTLLEERFEREEGLEKWFVQIRPLTPQNP
ncbi:MAG: transposase [Chloroflexi bacterium]|nr:transposase [Chloroflexota bacterium]